MSSELKCPFCLAPMSDPERHVDTHATSQDLTLFVFDKVYHLEELEEGYRCPLCTFSALPYGLYSHLRSHFSLQPPASRKRPGPSEGEDGGRPTKKQRLDARPEGHSSPVVVSQPQRLSSSLTTPSSSVSSQRQAANPFSNKVSQKSTLITPSTSSSRMTTLTHQPCGSESSTPFSQDPSTPTPYHQPNTPSSSLNPDRHADGVVAHIRAIRTTLSVGFQSQTFVVSKFLGDHKGTCMLHTVLGRAQSHPHDSLKACDLADWFQNPEYHAFRTAFRRAPNPGRCGSCGCPKIDGIPHEGTWNGPPNACLDEGLQEWILGLAFYAWKYTHLRNKILTLLGIPLDSFENRSDLEGAGTFARWLGQKNGRDVSWVSSNLLDFLYIVASNAQDLFTPYYGSM